ncbi:MAG TPA: hotdog domain-containing protein [Variovorax sp.]|nr:hotdog domain-containing protein [Variovorax sp.]
MSSLTLRFLAESGTSHIGGRIPGGIVMRWIDEAGCACATNWARRHCVAVFVGSVRFQRPVHVGSLVEVEAHMAYTGRTGMNLSVEVRSGDPAGDGMQTVTECLIVCVALDAQGRPVPVDAFAPATPGEMALAQRARAYLEGGRTASGTVPRGLPGTAAS